mmetsp:Transcript_5286/g.6666  ORF Transcript_5286/g.6666 Transcript_5286/m.6666 type:complete len:145 (-) Transcript_5286:690-1124(-)
MKRPCPFCAILKGKTNRKILYKDERLIAFPARYPRSSEHIIVTPTEHILQTEVLSLDAQWAKTKTFTSKYQNQILHMAKIGGELLPEGSFVFHVPPFNSIEHFHMHCMKGKFSNFYRQLAHTPGYPWCLDVDTLIRKCNIHKSE